MYKDEARLIIIMVSKYLSDDKAPIVKGHNELCEKISTIISKATKKAK